jgi:hypothetical protein
MCVGKNPAWLRKVNAVAPAKNEALRENSATLEEVRYSVLAHVVRGHACLEIWKITCAMPKCNALEQSENGAVKNT